MASLSEMIQLCRLCLVKDHVNIPIFDDPENVRQIPLKISSCLPVKISIDDNLPKKICDGCSNKLDLCYEFWNSTAHAEKTLLAMVEEKENQVPEAEMPQPFLLKVEAVESLEESQNQICEPPVPKPIPTLVKDEEEAEDPPAKRPRRSAAIQAQMQIIPESDDEDDAAEGLATTKEVAEMDDDFEDPDVPDMIVDIDEVKPGPSGLNQTGVNSQVTETIYLEVEEPAPPTVQLAENKRIIPRLMHWCHICGKCFNRNLDLNKHFAFVHFGDKRHQCKHCNANYKEKESLLSHVRRTHKKEKREWVLCETCGTTCSDVLQLKKHRAEVHAQSNRVTCEWCHEDFESERAFKKHFKQHTREIVKTCDMCQEPFYDLSKYRHHMRTSHTDEFLVCSYCSKMFVSQAELGKHEALHHPTKLEECPVCQKRVKYLKNHLADVHFLEEVDEVEERGCVCDVCGAQFKLEKHLKRHMAKHIKDENED